MFGYYGSQKAAQTIHSEDFKMSSIISLEVKQNGKHSTITLPKKQQDDHS